MTYKCRKCGRVLGELEAATRLPQPCVSGDHEWILKGGKDVVLPTLGLRALAGLKTLLTRQISFREARVLVRELLESL